MARDGDAAEGERLARTARRDLLAGPYADSVLLADIDVYLASVLTARQQDAEAQRLREEALAVYRRVYGAGHPSEQAVLAELAEHHKAS